MSGGSAIYRGRLRHRRFRPRERTFSYHLDLLALDLDDLPELFDRLPLVSARRPAPWRFRRADYHGDPGHDLRDAVRNSIAAELGSAPQGSILLCTQIRAFGFVFNPVSFYFAQDRDGRPAAVLAEITNTPWLERHHYVLGAGHRHADGSFRSCFRKDFHVSPFMPMEQDYTWRIGTPGEDFVVSMRNTEAGERVFAADMRLERRPFGPGELARLLLRRPWWSAGAALGIYYQALRLRLAGIPFHVHPARRRATTKETTGP